MVEFVTEAWCKCLNEPKVIKKNLHKSYLVDFKKAGLNVIPTYLIKKGSKNLLTEVIRRLDLQEFVLKPAISLSAHNTFHIRNHSVQEYESVFAEMLLNGDVLIQPFMPKIQTEGELSLIFIDRKFTHAVQKLPKPNDFGSRVTLAEQ